METETKDTILEKLRVISGIAEMMMMYFDNGGGQTENQAFVTCLNLICSETEDIRKMIR